MAEITKVNGKVINDPLYSPVIRFLEKRIQDLEANGPKEELDLAKQRYTGIVAGDLVIENPITFPDGVVRVCFVSRKTGFARADVDITRVELRDVLTDFKVKMVEVDTLEDLEAYVRANKADKSPVLFDMVWANKFGIMVTQEDAKTTEGAMKALGNLFFNKYQLARQSETYMDPITLESGTVEVRDAAIPPTTLALFIHELIVAEVDIPEITTNLPPDFTTRRGELFKIPMTIWFGTEDITLTAKVDITTAQGYTNPKRSDDLLYLEGQTIFGAADRQVRDDVIVRVTHTLPNGREIKKTFRMTAIIEPDELSKLTFEVEPETVIAQQGDTVEFTVKAFYEGVQVKIGVPPSKFTNEKKWGDLSYISQTPDGVMTYGGGINGRLLPGQEQDGDLYSCEFSWTDAGIIVKAKAYLNAVLKSAESMPQFSITQLDSTITGYALDKGLMKVEGKYGEEILTADKLGIGLGNKGPKQLIRFDSITTEGVNYTLLADSGVDGVTIDDIFKQQFVHKTPNGVRKVIDRDIRVYVKRDSVVKITPDPAVEKTVTKYQKGGIPFVVTVNGVNKMKDIRGLSFTEPKNQIRLIDDKTNTWQCLATEVNDAKTVAKYTFSLEVDGAVKTFTYDQPYLVKAWKGKEVVAIPDICEIKGDNHSSSSFSFTLYRDDKIISNTAVRYPAEDIIPSTVSITRVVPVAQTEFVRIDYERTTPGKEDGRIAITDQRIANPTPNQVAWVSLITDVTQARILELVEKEDGDTSNVDDEFTVKVKLNFAGKPITLRDSALTIKLEDKSPFTIRGVTDDAITLITTNYEKPGTQSNKAIGIDFTFIDAVNDNKKVELRVRVDQTIVYPPVVIKNNDPIHAKIWDKGHFSFGLISHKRDFAPNVTEVVVVGDPNKYIATDNSLNWNVFNAEKTETAFTLPLRLRYRYSPIALSSLDTSVRTSVVEREVIVSGNVVVS